MPIHYGNYEAGDHRISLFGGLNNAIVYGLAYGNSFELANKPDYIDFSFTLPMGDNLLYDLKISIGIEWNFHQ